MHYGWKFFCIVIFVLIAVILMITFIPMMLQMAFAQNTTPTIQPTSPTITNVPTPTTPNPNWQFLPQKAYVQPFGPEVGIPPNALPLTSVPQVIPVPQVQNQGSGGILDQFGGTAGILALVGAAGVYIKTHLMNKVLKENAVQIVKSKEVEQSIAKQVYENMPDKGDSINDKPEIKLETLKDNKEEATKTAAKA